MRLDKDGICVEMVCDHDALVTNAGADMETAGFISG